VVTLIGLRDEVKWNREMRLSGIARHTDRNDSP